MEPIVQNLICTVELAVSLKLSLLTKLWPGSKYNPEKFSALILKIQQPKSTLLIFYNGNVVCTGTKLVDDAILVIELLCTKLAHIGYKAVPSAFKVRNVVGSFDMNHPIRVEDLCLAYPKQCTYTPELFPALKFQLTNPKMCVLIFHKGKLILTGGKSIEELRHGFTCIVEVLKEFGV
jgi:transcription initiation factor TFIID TATA-box-binding protein